MHEHPFGFSCIDMDDRVADLERALNEAQLSLVRIHTWAGRALAATPDIDLGEQGKAIIEDIYAEAAERVAV